MSPSETCCVVWRPHMRTRRGYSAGLADSLICVKSESLPLATGNVNGHTALVSFTPRLGDL